MSQVIPRQHPAVVLRSQYVQLRVLLAIAMIAVVGLSAAVVILATNDGAGSSSVSSGRPASVPGEAPALRPDGGPEESTRGPLDRQREAPGGAALRPDGGPEESTRLR